MTSGHPSGLLLVDKPTGWTSHDVVAALRRHFPRRTKVGHTGTLDPMASGLLILLVGKATRSAARFQKLPKVYAGSIRLGVETDTWDLDGKVLREAPAPALAEAELRSVFGRYQGDVELPVPSYSAVKYKGKPLYEYARKGQPVPEHRRVSRIESWTLEGWESPEARFRLSCSSGTYARALAAALGRELGCGAALSSLRRERVGDYDVNGARDAQRLKEEGCAGLLAPVEEALR